jgi:putative transposase
MIGVRADGTKELVALTDGHRESSESWADLLWDCKRRGMAAPVLAIGDGALGFWAALRDVFPATREQRCWFHKIANVLNALPKSAQPGARAALAEIWNAEDREHAEAAARSFVAEYGTKWPKAVAKLTDDLDVLLECYNYPPSTGSTCVPRTRSSRPSPPSATAQRSPRGPARRPPGSRWRTS